MTENPFRALLKLLSTEHWQPVTLEFLTTVTDLVNKDEPVVTTYGEAFEVLRFLEKAEIIELEPAEDAGSFKIRKRF